MTACQSFRCDAQKSSQKRPDFPERVQGLFFESRGNQEHINSSGSNEENTACIPNFCILGDQVQDTKSLLVSLKADVRRSAISPARLTEHRSTKHLA